MDEKEFEKAVEAKNTLIKYLEKKREGYDGSDVWERYGSDYLVLIALNQDYFLDN